MDAKDNPFEELASKFNDPQYRPDGHIFVKASEWQDASGVKGDVVKKKVTGAYLKAKLLLMKKLMAKWNFNFEK